MVIHRLMTPKKIFLSYSRVDGAAFAKRLAVDLKKEGFDVWIDQEDIKAGLKWDAEVEKALESCDCVLFLETERSVVSNNVLAEVYYALEQNKKVIPLIIVDSKTPYRLSRLQHIDFTADYETGFALLVNELQDQTPALLYPEAREKIGMQRKAPFSLKRLVPYVMITGLALLVAIFFLLPATDKGRVSAEMIGVIAATDTSTASKDVTTNRPPIRAENITEEMNAEGKKDPANFRGKASTGKTPVSSSPVNTTQPAARPPAMEKNGDNVNETVAGDWRLVDVEPNARLHRGYLKIEALDQNKAAIKSYVQFYYPDSKASSSLTVFNAFANCSSCALSKEIKLTVEDVAVGSRTIKTLEEDQADGKKAGEVIREASANKSIGGKATLHFVNNNNAVLKIQQFRTIVLSDELLLEPFVYTFRFRKEE